MAVPNDAELLVALSHAEDTDPFAAIRLEATPQFLLPTGRDPNRQLNLSSTCRVRQPSDVRRRHEPWHKREPSKSKAAVAAREVERLLEHKLPGTCHCGAKSCRPGATPAFVAQVAASFAPLPVLHRTYATYDLRVEARPL